MKLWIALLAITLSVQVTTANAEFISGTTLSVDFQSGYIQGAGRKINMFRVPVTDSKTGTTTYYDAVFDFTVGANGITFDRTSYATSTAVQATSVQNMILGNYADTNGVLFSLIKTTGLNDGRDQLSLLSITSGKDFAAKYATGPLTNHPILSSQMQSYCAKVDVGVFGATTIANYLPFNQGGSFDRMSRIKQIDNQRIEFSILYSDCSTNATGILTRN